MSKDHKYMVESGETYKATKVESVKSIPQADKIVVKAVNDGKFYEKGEEIETTKDNIMNTKSEIETFMRTIQAEVEFNNSEIQ